MNRQLKFRVWSNSEGMFIEQSRIEMNNNGELYDIYNAECDLAIQQFTGLKDKNGREIFEGDILKVKGQLIGSYFREGGDELPVHPNNTIYTWLCKVIWDNGYASFLLEYINKPDYQGRGKFQDEMIGTAPWAEVVGNIFENPELCAI